MKTTCATVLVAVVSSSFTTVAVAAAPEASKPVVVTTAQPESKSGDTLIRIAPAATKFGALASTEPAWEVTFSGWSLGRWGTFLPGTSSTSNPGITLFSVKF